MGWKWIGKKRNAGGYRGEAYKLADRAENLDDDSLYKVGATTKSIHEKAKAEGENIMKKRKKKGGGKGLMWGRRWAENPSCNNKCIYVE